MDKVDSSASAHTTDPATRAGDPFAYAGDERPHGCYSGVVYIGELVLGESGEEEEVLHPVLCRRCNAGAGEAL